MYFLEHGVPALIEKPMANTVEECEEIELPGDDNIMDEQIAEFVKMINGEENELVTPEYGKAVIDALEKAFSQL